MSDPKYSIQEGQTDIAVIKERLSQLERRCDKKDARLEKLEADINQNTRDVWIELKAIGEALSNKFAGIEDKYSPKFDALFAFQNKMIGYSVLAALIMSAVINYVSQKFL